MIYKLKKLFNYGLEITFGNLSINYLLFTINLKKLKLIFLKRFVKNIFSRLMFSINCNKKNRNKNIDLIVFILDKLIFNIKMLLRLSVSMMQGEWNLAELQEQLTVHYSHDNFDPETMNNVINFQYGFHMNCNCNPVSNYDTRVLSPRVMNIPYFELFGNNRIDNVHNTVQGTLHGSLYNDLPVHTTYTIEHQLGPIESNFFANQRRPFCVDGQGHPLLPGYIMRQGNFMYRYIPDHMLYFGYNGGQWYNSTGWGLLNQCPFGDVVHHPAHQGFYGFQFCPVYRIYKAEPFENDVVDMEGLTGQVDFLPSGLPRLPKVISNSIGISGWDVLYDYQPNASRNEVYIIQNGEPDDWLVISDRDLNNKLSLCRGGHFLNRKKLVFYEMGDDPLVFDNLVGGDASRISVCKHYDIAQAVLITKYNNQVVG